LGEGAADVASLGQALVAAVDGFARAGEALTGHLQRLDESLGQAMARSDEQLAYYVAQAREVIDLSLSAQQQIVADLQRVAAGRLAPAGA
jgi:DNA anti-recombination protein RmuC